MNLKQAIIDGKERKAAEIAKKLLEEISPHKIIEKLSAALDVVGKRFERNEIFLPELICSADAADQVREILKPKLTAGEIKARGKLLIGTVKGDIHDIGKNIVGAVARGEGFQVVDLGTDVTANQFIKGIKEHRPDIVGFSGLITTSLSEMEKIIKAIDKAGLHKKVKIMVGGAPVTEKWAKKAGADSYAKDAPSAVRKALKFCQSS